jgi:hypothetical protein
MSAVGEDLEAAPFRGQSDRLKHGRHFHPIISRCQNSQRLNTTTYPGLRERAPSVWTMRIPVAGASSESGCRAAEKPLRPLNQGRSACYGEPAGGRPSAVGSKGGRNGCCKRFENNGVVQGKL